MIHSWLLFGSIISAVVCAIVYIVGIEFLIGLSAGGLVFLCAHGLVGIIAKHEQSQIDKEAEEILLSIRGRSQTCQLTR